ncbi:MAG: hypothetical protein WBA09_14650, partial [Candidatus Acidiferrum sp.]
FATLKRRSIGFYPIKKRPKLNPSGNFSLRSLFRRRPHASASDKQPPHPKDTSIPFLDPT